MHISLLFILIFTVQVIAQELIPPKLIPPKLLQAQTPAYPAHLKEQGIEGTVKVDLLVNESGVVESCSLINSLNPILDSISLEAAKGLLFTPGHVENEPVAVNLVYLFRFSLDKDINSIRNNARIKGVVRVRGTSRPLAGAEIKYTPADSLLFGLPADRVLQKLAAISIKQFQRGDSLVTISDSLGCFTFRGVPQGAFKLDITSEEILPYSRADTVPKDKVLRIEAITAPVEFSQYEVTTTYSSSKEVSRRELSAGELENVAGSGGDPIKALQSLPGTARISGGDELIIRGAHPDDNKFYLDDIDIPYLFHYGNMHSVVPLEALSGISFYPSAYGSYYGNCIGGVISAETNTPEPNKYKASVDLNIVNTGLFLDTKPLSSLRVIAGGRISDRTGLIKRYIKEISGNDGVIPKYSDYFGKVQFKPFNNHNFTFSFLGAIDSLITVSGTPWDFLESRRFNRAALIWNWKMSKKLSQTFIYAHLAYRNRRSHAVKNDYGVAEQKFMTTNYFRSRWDWDGGGKTTVSAGIQGDLRHTLLGAKRLDSETGELSSMSSELSGAYGTFSPWLDINSSPVEAVSLKAGIRYDYYKELRYSGTMFPAFKSETGGNTDISGDPSIRFGIKYRINNKHLVKMGLGNYNQSPKPDGIGLSTENKNSIFSSTKAAHYVLGYECDLLNRLKLDIQGYYNRRWDIPFKSEDDSTSAWGQSGKGRSYGIEFLLRHHRTEHFSGWLSYTLSRSEEKTVSDFTPIDHDQTHNIQFTGTCFLPAKFSVSTKFHYTSGNPVTPVDSVSYHKTVSSDNSPQIYRGEVNSVRLDPAVKLDIRISKKHLFRKAAAELYLDIPNILYPLYKTPEYREFNVETGEYKLFYITPVPTFGVKIAF